MKYVIGVDLGGSTIKGGIVSSLGKISNKVCIDTGSKLGKTVVLKNLFSIIDILLSENKKVSCICVGCAGDFDLVKKKIINSPNIPLEGINLKQVLKKKFKKKVIIENDSNCFTLGEAIFGSGKKFKVVIGLTLGSGVGGGIVIDKKLFRGVCGAGEFGHMIMDGENEVEDYVSRKGFEYVLRKLDINSPKDLFLLAKKGNNEAVESFELFGKNLGVVVTNLIHCFDPDCIIIGGNISDSWSFFNKSMFKEIAKKAKFNHANIIKRTLGDDAAILGAASLGL